MYNRSLNIKNSGIGAAVNVWKEQDCKTSSSWKAWRAMLNEELKLVFFPTCPNQSL